MTNLRVCAACEAPTRPYRANPADYAPNVVPMKARGLCDRCYSRHKRGTLGLTPDRVPVSAREERIENIEWLLTYDRNAEAIATRSGFTNAATAVRSLQRWGRKDLASTLSRYAGTGDVYHNNYDTAA